MTILAPSLVLCISFAVALRSRGLRRLTTDAARCLRTEDRSDRQARSRLRWCSPDPVRCSTCLRFLTICETASARLGRSELDHRNRVSVPDLTRVGFPISAEAAGFSRTIELSDWKTA